MEIDPNMIVNALLAFLFGGGFLGGGKLVVDRVRANRLAAQQAEAEFSNIPNTEKTQILDMVTGSEFRDTRKDINDSIHEVRTEVKEGMDRQHGQLTKLTENVSEIKEALAGQEARVLKAVGHGVREHESRFQHRTRGTRDYSKPGSQNDS